MAVYDISGLTYQGPLDLFWRKLRKVDKALRNALVSVLTVTIQANGSDYHPEGRLYAYCEIVRRVINDLVSEPEAYVDPPPRLALVRGMPIFNALKGSGVPPSGVGLS